MEKVGKTSKNKTFKYNNPVVPRWFISWFYGLVRGI